MYDKASYNKLVRVEVEIHQELSCLCCGEWLVTCLFDSAEGDCHVWWEVEECFITFGWIKHIDDNQWEEYGNKATLKE